MSHVPGFALRKPCAHCPFRADRPFPLHPERAQEFAEGLIHGGGFNCHKTVTFGDTDTDDDEVQINQENTNWCAGALITMEKSGVSNQQVRIAERLGLYDPKRLDMDAPVYPSLTAWVESYGDAS